MKNRGACLCGVVSYEVQGPYKWFSHCHCSMCRKHHGTFHSTVLAVAKENFRYLQGADAIVHYKSSANNDRAFCKHCGSKVPGEFGDLVIIPAGTLADDPGIKPSVRIFVGHKSPMETITDSLTSFDAYPPGFGAAVDGPKPAVTGTGMLGSCLCGQIAFELDAKPAKVVQCHCTRCQRSRGTAHGVNVLAPDGTLTFLRGQANLQHFRLPNTHMFATDFCKTCGSLMPSKFDAVNMWIVPVGALDTSFDLQAATHIYVDSKAPWFEITDSYPKYGELPPRERMAEVFSL